MRLQFNSRFVDGYIQYSECTNCSNKLHNLILQGDTDMATMGLVNLTEPDTKNIILTEATNEEWSGYKTELIAKRISKETGSNGYIVVTYQNFVNTSNEKEWLPICPICLSKHRLTTKKTFPDFIDDDGIIRVLDSFDEEYKDQIQSFLIDLHQQGGIMTLEDSDDDPFKSRLIIHCMQNRYIRRLSSHPLDFKDVKLTELGIERIHMHNNC